MDKYFLDSCILNLLNREYKITIFVLNLTKLAGIISVRNRMPYT